MSFYSKYTIKIHTNSNVKQPFIYSKYTIKIHSNVMSNYLLVGCQDMKGKKISFLLRNSA